MFKTCRLYGCSVKKWDFRISGSFWGHKNAHKWTKSKKCAKVHYMVNCHSWNTILKVAKPILGWCEKVRLKNSAYPVLQCKMPFLMTFWAQILQFFSTYVLPNIFFLKDICMNNTDKAKNWQKKFGPKMTPPPPTEPLCNRLLIEDQGWITLNQTPRSQVNIII